MYIVFTDHAKLRLKQSRQDGIVKNAIISKLSQIPGKIAYATRFKIAAKNKTYDIVVHDKKNERIVITIIGL